MRLFIILLMFSCQCVANVAIDEINQIIEAKSINKKQMVSKRSDIFLRDYEFIFVFRSTCPHCHKFAPVLKDFSDTFSIKVNAYSFDGPDIKGFKSNPLSKDLLQALFLDAGFKTVVPALYLINKETQETYPVLFGEATPAQLAIRISQLMQKIKERRDA